MADSPKTVQDVIKAGTDFLAGKGVEQPRLACELLASRLLRCRRLDLYLRYDAVVEEKHRDAMRRGLQRVAAGEPVQYVLGQWDFMGHVFKTDRRALIPRPETEQLVERVLKSEPLWKGGRPAIVDVGTGSGCIAISLALAKPGAAYLALDTSAEALALARENAARLGVADKIAFVEGELSDCVEPAACAAIVSNPPYIATPDYEKLPVSIRDHEPRAALDGGPNGMAAIEAVVQDAAVALKPGGSLFLEIGETQAAAVRRLLEGVGFVDVESGRDLNGKDRFAQARLPAEG